MLSKIRAGEDIEVIMTELLMRVHKKGPVEPDVLEALTYISLYHHEVFVPFEKRLLYLMGLFYKVSPPIGALEEVYSIYSEAIFEELGIRYTPVQAEAYKYIHEKSFFSFSAPTSSGKSFLFRDIIKHCNKDIVIVVPSRALISEYMLAVLEIVDKSVLVMQFIENINQDNITRRIYIVTPERAMDIFSIVNELNIELLLFDEAQISEEEIRGIKFDSLVRRLDNVIPNSKKVFAHPFVTNPDAQLKKHGFDNNSISAIYNQQAVGKLFISKNKNIRIRVSCSILSALYIHI